MGVLLKPLLKTKRLNLFRVQLEPSRQNKLRDVWLGFRRDVDCPMLAVSLTVWPLPKASYCELIETSQLMRGRGLAREAWTAVSRYYGGLSGIPRTPPAKAFAKRMEIPLPVFEELKP